MFPMGLCGSAWFRQPPTCVMAQERGCLNIGQPGWLAPMWMKRHHGDVPFERYADDAVCHCRSQARAQMLIDQLRERFAQCGLELHPQKTRVVFCKDSNRRGDYPDTMVLWATHKFKRLRGRRRRASHWLARIVRRNPQLFAHWPLLWEQA